MVYLLTFLRYTLIKQYGSLLSIILPMEYCSQSRNSNVWLLQRASQCSVQMDRFKFPKVSICAQNTSGLNFCVFCGSSSHPQILSSMNIWAKVLHNCCKNGRRMRCTLTCSTVDFVACLGTNRHQFSIRLPNTPNATNNILFYCCLCVASCYIYDCALLRISLAFSTLVWRLHECRYTS